MAQNHRYSILVIDDEEEIRELLRELLSSHFTVHTAANGVEGVSKAREIVPDLILLDIRMPKMDGISACEELRKNAVTQHIPVMILTAVDDFDHKIRAFNSGADDFILKPFHSREIIARIFAKIRRIEEASSEHDELSCGNLSLKPERYEVEVDGSLIKLSVLEFNLLQLLVASRKKVLSREQILNAVWKGNRVSDRTVDTHIASLRRKLKGFDYRFSSVYSAGYILKPLALAEDPLEEALPFISN